MSQRPPSGRGPVPERRTAAPGQRTPRQASQRPPAQRPGPQRSGQPRPGQPRPTQPRGAAPGRTAPAQARPRPRPTGGGAGRPPAPRRLPRVANPRRRARALLLGVLVVLSVFATQLVRVQGLNAAEVAAEGAKLRSAKVEIPATRGVITSADGVTLAASLERKTVTLDQTAVCTFGTKNHNTCDAESTPGALDRAATALAPLLGTTVESLRPRLAGRSQYVVLARDVSTLTWRRINALGVPGIYAESTTQRTYPTSTTSAALVGVVGQDGRGLEGLELMEDDVLSGRSGVEYYERSGSGGAIPVGKTQITPAQPGRDIRLTINSNVQWYAQNALAQMVRRTGAQSGTVIVQDVRTGKLVAVASFPTYDPNQLRSLDGNLQNTAFTEVFEPGSTSKIMTMAAAIEEGKVTPETPVIIPSQIRRYDRIFHDSHPHGTLLRTVAGALAESSNMGTIFVGETMTAKVLESYLRKFGLGAKSGVGFVGESPGLLVPADRMDGAQRYTIMFGQGLSVTAIQAASVFQTIANGGVRVAPTLIDAVADPSGTMVDRPDGARTRVVSAKTAQEVSEMLEGVVSENGTAPKARIPGYRVAGKTGTADRINPTTGTYAGGGKTGSFIGYAPADDPRLVVAVILQKPVRGYYGGVVAAPVFHDVMTYALQELAIPPTGTAPPRIRTVLDAVDPDAPGVLQDRARKTGR